MNSTYAKPRIALTIQRLGGAGSLGVQGFCVSRVKMILTKSNDFRPLYSKDLAKQIKQLRAELSDPEQELLIIEQFLNLVVDEEKVVSYQMTKAFSKLEKA